MAEKEPPQAFGKQAFDVEHAAPAHGPEVDSRGLRKSDLEQYDDDGHVARQGGWFMGYANIVTAVIGSGVLSLAWSMSWLGWPGGAACIVAFAWVTLYCSELLIDVYRWPDINSPQRNYTYMEVVTRYLGKEYAIFCGIIQYLNMFVTGVGYTLTAGVAITAVQKSDCYHFTGTTSNDPDPSCHFSQTPWIVFMGALQIVFSQIQDIDRIWLMSVIATIMSFTYSFIGVGLSIAMATNPQNGTGSADGLWAGNTPAQKTWGIFQALGSIAFAYSFSFILIEITDTLKSPGENAAMKKATRLGIGTTTSFYAAIGFIGYAAFGNGAPGNLISGFGFYEPYWLVDIANIAVFIHLLGAFQVWMQPLYGFVEMSLYKRFPGQAWLQYELFSAKVKIPGMGLFRLSPFRLIWRSITVVIITLLALLLGNCFNDIIAFLGSIGFAPLTVFLPIQMHIVQKKIPTFSVKWCLLQLLNVICWLVTIVAAIGSIQGMIMDTQGFQAFKLST